MRATGEDHAGATVPFVNGDIDPRDAIEVRRFPIFHAETLDQFIRRSKQIHCDVLLQAIDKINRGHVESRPLSKQDGSYFGFPTRAAYREFRRRGRRLW